MKHKADQLAGNLTGICKRILFCGKRSLTSSSNWINGNEMQVPTMVKSPYYSGKTWKNFRNRFWKRLQLQKKYEGTYFGQPLWIHLINYKWNSKLLFYYIVWYHGKILTLAPLPDTLCLVPRSHYCMRPMRDREGPGRCRIRTRQDITYVSFVFKLSVLFYSFIPTS